MPTGRMPETSPFMTEKVSTYVFPCVFGNVKIRLITLCHKPMHEKSRKIAAFFPPDVRRAQTKASTMLTESKVSL